MIKKQITILLSILFCFLVSAQDKSTQEKLIEELSENACECVDSISLFNRNKTDVIKDIHSCIDKNTLALQLGSLLADVEKNSKKTDKKNQKKQININVDTSQNSEQYKDSYNAIERYMMKNCPSLKNAVNVAESKSEKLSKNEKAIEFYNIAIAASKKEDWKEAIKNYENAVVEDPDFTYAWDNLGVCYRRVEDYDKALIAYKKSLEVDPKGKMALQNIPIVYSYKKEHQKAIDAYKELDKVYPNDPEVYYGMGNVYFNGLKDDEKGLDYISKAYKIYNQQKSPYRTDAETIMGLIYRKMKQEDKIDKFKEILKNNNIDFE
ncbi:tetratricopeptide repeat protein [Chryseobacterium takakiae]|jgi:tetratricopeptide (TPR) repeat protein|uniref:Tetratricopeptide repeat-containing protein n=1 Tax=Chryseobacterium takakiae TaxID=1302685 RepID=A0A1M4XRQ6_9FLAO|nr:tetratricopeptide repeat protein [Chryseobacterium takakiae]SHE95932.1 Tetratricopeptide repeat-containing protein [Chryseobacterium takakiae]